MERGPLRLLERIAAAEATPIARSADLPVVKDLHAAWRRGDLSVADKRRVLTAVIERIVINRGVQGRSIVGNRPEDRVEIHLASQHLQRLSAQLAGPQTLTDERDLQEHVASTRGRSVADTPRTSAFGA